MVIGEKRNHLVTVFVIFLFLLTFFSGCVSIKYPHIPDMILSNGWYENTSLRNTGIQFLGLEKWCSSVYEIHGKYPASLTVTALKTLFLTNENELFKKTLQSIEDTFQKQVTINESTQITGTRVVEKNHQTMYVVYDGLSTKYNEKIKLIGEVWNCGSSGISLICIGLAYITNNDFPDLEYTENWKKIIMDSFGIIENVSGENGLIYNIQCH
jgi:hypothetical protein